jgi:hypothetical protein
VYTWVDGSDPRWLEKRRRSQPSGSEDAAAAAGDQTEMRFRNRDELRFSLRSVAAFFPMVRRIYVVTDDQVPEWLDVEHPAISVVDHRTIFDDPSWLPTFNSNAIETQLANIPGIAEHWLYFNDDVMLLGPCTEQAFFLASGLGRSFLESERSQYGDPSASFHNSKNAVLNSSRVLAATLGKSFHQFHLHTPFALRTSVFREMGDVFSEVLESTARSRFRAATDVAPISSLYQWYALATGRHVPSMIANDYLNLGTRDVVEQLNALSIVDGPATLCLNDAVNPALTADKLDAAVHDTLMRLYPVAAVWEK